VGEISGLLSRLTSGRLFAYRWWDLEWMDRERDRRVGGIRYQLCFQAADPLGQAQQLLGWVGDLLLPWSNACVSLAISLDIAVA